MELYERLEELDADKAEMRASRILHGLGFTAAMQQKKLKDFSGGWRMRVALARYLHPTATLHSYSCSVSQWWTWLPHLPVSCRKMMQQKAE